LATQADSPAVRAWEGQTAVALFEQAQAMAPSDTTKMDLAAAYIDGAGETMKGVQMLLGIVRENPSNVPAALMLGKMAIESGQWDKATARFESVLKIDPDNREALYFLAESYKGSGNRAKAIETFERVKKAVGNPDFSRDIDAYLKTF
jgi:cytochrome c-type biogenesis protein CcmH/NrfG